jgi:hypothetical protein
MHLADGKTEFCFRGVVAIVPPLQTASWIKISHLLGDWTRLFAPKPVEKCH